MTEGDMVVLVVVGGLCTPLLLLFLWYSLTVLTRKLQPLKRLARNTLNGWKKKTKPFLIHKLTN